MIGEWTTAALIVVGGVFSTIAAVGILRMPDLYMRIQAATKASTLGVSCIACASIVHLDGTGATTHAVLIIAFLFLTAPVAAHMIGRAAYTAGVSLWRGTVVDELEKEERARAGRSVQGADTPGRLDEGAEA